MMTFDEIGQVLGLSKQRVQQIHDKALAKLRRKRMPMELLMAMAHELDSHRFRGGNPVSRPTGSSSTLRIE